MHPVSAWPSRRAARRHRAHEAAASCLALLLLCGGPVRTAAQQAVLIPNQMTKSMTFELQSVEDEVQLYEGDPQFLLKLDLKPIYSIVPHVEFSNTAQVGTLRVRDLSLLEKRPEPTEEELQDPDFPKPDDENERPVSQTWIMEFTPSAPTEFVLKCDGGKGLFDFTDIPVQSVHMLADTAQVRMEFKRPNLVDMERLKLTAQAGRVDLRDLLHARIRLATLNLEAAECDVAFTGRPSPGETEVFFEGEPRSLRLRVSREVGVRIEGPSGTVARFDRKDMVRRGLSLETPDFETRPSRLRLHFVRILRELEVEWED